MGDHGKPGPPKGKLKESVDSTEDGVEEREAVLRGEEEICEAGPSRQRSARPGSSRQGPWPSMPGPSRQGILI